mmetsp:Transcript_54355/g.151394  ORF Transcript_54355/g.151394 Transcript_54355/m.151394 type:complete len:347 (+) Transcript_54355:586-1626(+)
MDGCQIVGVRDARVAASAVALDLPAQHAPHSRRHLRRCVHVDLVNAPAWIVLQTDVVAGAGVVGVAGLAIFHQILHALAHLGHRDVSLSAVGAVCEALHLAPLRRATQVRRVASRLDARGEHLLARPDLEAFQAIGAVHRGIGVRANSGEAAVERRRSLEEVAEDRPRGTPEDSREDVLLGRVAHVQPINGERTTRIVVGLVHPSTEELSRRQIALLVRHEDAQERVRTIVCHVRCPPIRHHEGQLAGLPPHRHALDTKRAAVRLQPRLEDVSEKIGGCEPVHLRAISGPITHHRVDVIVAHDVRPLARGIPMGAMPLRTGGEAVDGLESPRVGTILLGPKVRVPG